MLKYLATFANIILFVFVLFLLGIDAFGSPDSSLRYFRTDSSYLAIVFLIINIILAFANYYFFPRAWVFINKLLFGFFSAISLVLIVLNNLNYPEYVFNKTTIQVANFIILAIFTGGNLYIYYSSYLVKDIIFKKVIYFSAPLLLFLLILVNVFNPSVFKFLTKEDGAIETIQSVAFFVSAVLAFKAALNYFRKKSILLAVLFLFLSFGLFFITGEEMSWGQRIFNIATPEAIKSHNLQGEITIHNTSSIQSNLYLISIFIGLYGSLSRILFNKFVPKKWHYFRVLTPPSLLFLYFFTIFAIYFLHQYQGFYFEVFTAESSSISKWLEVSELFLSLGFLFFTLPLALNTKEKD